MLAAFESAVCLLSIRLLLQSQRQLRGRMQPLCTPWQRKPRSSSTPQPVCKQSDYNQIAIIEQLQTASIASAATCLRHIFRPHTITLAVQANLMAVRKSRDAARLHIRRLQQEKDKLLGSLDRQRKFYSLVRSSNGHLAWDGHSATGLLPPLPT